jgi:hypothetical protein
MRQSWASALVVHWFPDTRLGAAVGGPSAGSSVRITHFRAAGVRFSLRALAGTRRSAHPAMQTARCVGQKINGKKQREAQNEAAPAYEEKMARATCAAHETDSARGGNKNRWSARLNLFVTWVIGPSRCGKRNPFREDYCSVANWHLGARSITDLKSTSSTAFQEEKGKGTL